MKNGKSLLKKIAALGASIAVCAALFAACDNLTGFAGLPSLPEAGIGGPGNPGFPGNPGGPGDPPITPPPPNCSACDDAGCNVCDPQHNCGTDGHNWGAWTETTPPTCAEPGERTRTCTHCGTMDTETQTIPALGHDWGDWVVTTPPTTTEYGEETRTCQRDCCTHYETRPLPPLGTNITHPPEGPTSGGVFGTSSDGTVNDIGNWNGHVTIPSEINGQPVIAIGNNGQAVINWATSPNAHSIDIPFSVATIASGAFSGVFLTEITIRNPNMTVPLPQEMPNRPQWTPVGHFAGGYAMNGGETSNFYRLFYTHRYGIFRYYGDIDNGYWVRYPFPP